MNNSSMYKSLLQPDLQQMVREADGQGLNAFCQTLFPGLIAEVVADMDPAEVWQVLSHASPQLQAEIFQYLDLHDQVRLVEAVDRQTLSRMIQEMAADDRVDLLGRLNQEQVDEILPLIAQAERNDIKKLLAYPEESAGSIMTTEYASLPVDITAGEAINRLRLQAPTRETIYYVYVTDEKRRLLGFLSLSRLIQARPTTPLSELLERDVIKVRVTDDQESVANELLRLGFIAIPVVDEEDRLVGIVTHDDAAEVLQEEATEDTHRLAAVEPLEDGYLATDLMTLAWKRGIWLVILLFAAFLTATVLNIFQPGNSEDQIDAENASAWMVLFIPLVLASGGNAGSQSATLIIRMLAVEDARGQRRGLLGRVFRRELQLGALLGLTVGLLAWLIAHLLVSSDRALVVGLTVFLVVTLGAVTGALLPLALRAAHLDPALMSNPLIAALVDMLGVVVYFQMARLLLGI